MNTHSDHHGRPVNKATMDQPQEEFIEDQPARIPDHNFDRTHGDEVGLHHTFPHLHDEEDADARHAHAR